MTETAVEKIIFSKLVNSTLAFRGSESLELYVCDVFWLFYVSLLFFCSYSIFSYHISLVARGLA